MTIDRETLENLRSIGDGGFVTEVINIYVEDAGPRIEAIRAAIHAGDAAKLASAAHALKSGAGNVGAMTVFHVCGDLEALARSGSIEGANQMLAQLESEHARAVRELREAVAAFT
jgi:HPt (histidine-containing phosphotransfer) domain-containing protein